MIENQQIGVSSSTFIDLSHQIPDGVKVIGARLGNGIHAPEIDQAFQVANELDIGLELAYRVGVEGYHELLRQLPRGVLQIHGPIFSNVNDAFMQGIHEYRSSSLLSRAKQAVMNPLIGRFAQGTLDRDWDNVLSLAHTHSTPNVVLHPRGPRHLQQINAQYDGIIIGIEPDFRRLQESEYIIWRMEEVMNIAEQTGAGIIIDISHAAISENTLRTLPELYHQAKKSPKGVVGIHFNVAIPTDNREDFFNLGTASRPLYRDTDDAAKGPILDFYQEVKRDPDFTGPFILEFWSFLPRENTVETRKRAVEETLEVLARS